MKHEDHQRAARISETAVKLPPEKKAEFLEKECGDDAELRRRVESLLEKEDTELLKVMDSFSERVAEPHAEGRPDESWQNHPASPPGHAGRRFGNYEIIRKIGAGGMGDVFLARDTNLNRKAALKILPEKFTSDPEHLRRFKQEARAASALNHPYILTIFEFGRDEQGVQFIASEYVEGVTLNKFYASEEPDLSRKLDVLIQIASALSAAHEAGIVHRDVKPENIIVRPDGYVKVLDFGLAKLVEKYHDPASGSAIATLPLVHTNPGTIMGTAYFLSPEQAKGKEVDARADIFSFGVVVYEAVSGRLPFTGNSAMEVIAAILHEEPEPLDDREVPPEIKRIVEKALRKRRDERYQTMKDLLLDLKEVRRELEFRDKLEEKSQSDARLSREREARADEARETLVIHAPQETLRMPPAARFSISQVLLFVLIAAAAGSAAIWWLVPGREGRPGGDGAASAGGPSPRARKTYEITNWANAAGELSSAAAFSRDAKFVAFGSTAAGTTGIWVKQTDKGDAIQVTKDDFYNRYPVWSPEGDEIAYYSKRGGTQGLWRVSLLGGEPKLIADNVEIESKPRLWSKSGKLYFQGSFNLFAADAGGGGPGEVRQVTDFPQTGLPVKVIKISPDESKIAFLSIEDGRWKIKIKPLGGDAGAEPAEIISSPSPIDNLVWQPDGKGVLYSRKTDEFFQIFSADLSGGGDGSRAPLQLSSGENDSFIQDVSADGARILFSTVTETSDLWRVDAEGAKETLTAAQINGELWPDVSPDGGMIAYQSVQYLRQGSNLLNGSLMAQAVSGDARPLRLAEDGFLPQWSPDGKTIAFLKHANLKLEIWRVAAAAGDQLRRLSAGGADGLVYSISPYHKLQVKHLSWSPDSAALAFPSEVEGLSNIWLAPADGGSAQRKLTANADPNLSLVCPIWSQDAKRIAFAAQTKKRDSGGNLKSSLWLYDAENGAQQKVLETDETVRLLGWSRTEDGLIFAVRKNERAFTPTPPETFVEAVSLKTGGRRRLAVLRDAYFNNIHLSPDRASVAFTSRSGGQDDVWISPLDGAAAAARKLTGNNDSRLFYSSLAWSPDGKAIYFGKQTRFTLLSMLVNSQNTEKNDAD